MTKIKAKIQLRRDTSANFTSVNPTLLLGEFAFETDTMTVTEGGSVSVKLKIGDGVNPWTELPYTTFGFQAVTWEDITGKPTEFAPAPHTHEIADVIGLEATLEAIAESIPAAQIQSDWNQTNNAALDFVKNKPFIPAAGLPAGGTAGQILTKVDDTDYNAEWQENFADWTSQVKHTVKNNGLSGTITKGTAVYVTGSNGTNMLVGKASNASEATSSKTMGLMQSDITTSGGNQTGFVITEGLLGGLNTAGQTAGDPVWLGVDGALIYGLENKPYAPAHLVFIGIVTKVSAGSGEIFVKVQNGFELKEIHDVDLISTAPINGHVLGFDGTLWVNKTVAGWLGFTPEPAIAAGTTSQYWRGDKSWQTLDKIAVGLGNVDNTSDLNKPISTATQTALNAKFTLPTLTAGSILFSNGTTIAQDNANLFWDNANKRLGIGTATPTGSVTIIGAYSSGTAAPLVVQNTTPYGATGYNQYVQLWLNSSGGVMGSIRNNGEFAFSNTISTSYFRSGTAGSASTPIYGGSGSNGIFFPAANTMAFTTNAVEAMRIFSTRNIGIGTTVDSGFKVDVNGTARVQGNNTSGANSFSASFLNGSFTTGNTVGSYVNAILTNTINNGAAQISVKNNSSLTGVFSIYGSAEVGTFFGVSRSSAVSLINESGTKLFIGNFNATDILIGTNNVERLRIKSTGQVCYFPLASAPAGGQAGDVYYDSTLNKLRVHNGTTWETITSV
jgi:hypothetical protein